MLNECPDGIKNDTIDFSQSRAELFSIKVGNRIFSSQSKLNVHVFVNLNVHETEKHLVNKLFKLDREVNSYR